MENLATLPSKPSANAQTASKPSDRPYPARRNQPKQVMAMALSDLHYYHYVRPTYQVQPQWKIQPQLYRLSKRVLGHHRCQLWWGKSARAVAHLRDERAGISRADAEGFATVQTRAGKLREGIDGPWKGGFVRDKEDEGGKDQEGVFHLFEGIHSRRSYPIAQLQPYLPQWMHYGVVWEKVQLSQLQGRTEEMIDNHSISYIHNGKTITRPMQDWCPLLSRLALPIQWPVLLRFLDSRSNSAVLLKHWRQVQSAPKASSSRSNCSKTWSCYHATVYMKIRLSRTLHFCCKPRWCSDDRLAITLPCRFWEWKYRRFWWFLRLICRECLCWR